jgi:hypothetical protein
VARIILESEVPLGFKSNQGSLTNADIDDRFYEKYEYLDLSSDQKNTFCLKCMKPIHVPDRGWGGNHTGGRGARETKL